MVEPTVVESMEIVLLLPLRESMTARLTVLPVMPPVIVVVGRPVYGAVMLVVSPAPPVIPRS